MATPVHMTSISRVEAWKCVFPLPAWSTLGGTAVDKRDYVIVRLVTTGGHEGIAFGLSRGAPVDVVITELLAPHVLGRDSTEPSDLTAAVSANLPHHADEGLVERGLSLLDIAAWDLKGKIADEPVWRLLGGEHDSAPILLTEGRPIPGENDEDFARRLRNRANQGYSALKIEAPTADKQELSQRLTTPLNAVGENSDLMIELAYSWVEEVVPADVFDGLDHRLAWVEDPVHGNDVGRLRQIKNTIGVPLAAGDEVTNPQVLHALIDTRAVDVLRVDITCIGGITGFASLYNAATDAGMQISTHVYPELHRHVVFGYPQSGPIEMFHETSFWNATNRFVQPPTAKSGSDGIMVIDAPPEPGLGLIIDWAVVTEFSIRHGVVTKETSKE